MRKPKRARIGRSGRRVYERHVRLHLWEIDSPAYRSLSVGARSLLVELKALYNGNNNGSLFLSVRDAAMRLGCHKSQAAKLFKELQDRGFIRIRRAGGFNVKATRGGGTATTWVLTEFPIGTEMGAGTRDFMRWRPPSENHSAVRPSGRPVLPGKTAPLKTGLTVLPGGTVSSKIGILRSAPADTDSLPREVA